MISRLVATLQHNEPDITAEDISDALWLALEMKKKVVETVEAEVTTSTEESATLSEQGTRSQQSAAEQTVQTTARQHASRGLYSDVSQHGGKRGQLLDTSPFRSPAAPALPDSRAIARALRPFKRRISLPGKFVLNEAATAKRIAEEGIWVPVLDYVSTRWLDIALVIDKGVSMTIWHQTIAELHRLIAHHGAFRDVRIWELDTNNPEMVGVYAETGANKHNRRRRSERELIDISRRRLILVVTDCVSEAWHSGAAARLLATWGRYNPVTLVQVLPQRLWSRTSLGMATSIRLHALSPGIPNMQFRVQQTSYWDNEDKEPRPGIAIPIVTLDSRPLAVWTRVIARAEDLWIPGCKLIIPSSKSKDNEGEHQEQSDYDLYKEAIAVPLSLSSAEHLRRFRVNASPPARRLAELLAIVPVTLPVVRLVQQTMLPESLQVHVAEVFLSGLLKVISKDNQDGSILDPDYVQYDFVDGVRELLLNTVLPADSRRVLSEISDFIASKSGHALDFRALLANPLARDKSEAAIDEAERPFALMGARALRRFGGDYEALADWLEEKSKNGEEVVKAGTETDTLNGVSGQELIQEKVGDEPFFTSSDVPDKPAETVVPVPPQIPPIPQSDQIIEGPYGGPLLSRKCVCPSCFEAIYIGDCRILSGRTTGKVLKEAPRGLSQLIARLNPEPLDGPRYALELAHRECTNCGYLLPYNIERVKNITLAVVGDSASGMSSYIAALIHQIKTEWMVNATGFARFTCLTPDIEKNYTRDYFEPLFTKQTTILPTQAGIKSTVDPLVYKLVVSPSPRHPPKTANLIFYDTTGGDYGMADKLVTVARFVLNASAFVFVVDPLGIPALFDQLPALLQDTWRPFFTAFHETSTRRAAGLLNSVVGTVESYRGYSSGAGLPNIPVAVMLSKSDLFKPLNQPGRYHFLINPQYGGGVDLRDIDTVDQEVRKLLETYKQGDLLAATNRLRRVKFFATSATGESPDRYGNYANINPCRCLDPLLWILYQFGVIEARV